MTRSVKVSCLQYCAQAHTKRNLTKIDKLMSSAVADGAALVCLPEYATCYGARRGRLQVGAEVEESHEGLSALRDMAKEKATWLLIGSIGIKRNDGLISNRSYLIDDAGEGTGHQHGSIGRITTGAQRTIGITAETTLLGQPGVQFIVLGKHLEATR